MISVIIPLYNKVHTIARTLETVFQQTYTDYEIVIVDDGSTDGSADVVRSIDDSRIRLISQANAGVSAARNRGIEEAQGEFVAFLDADDEWKPDYLETMMQLVEKYPQCDVFATNYELQNCMGKVSSTIIRRLPFEGNDGILSNYFEVACQSSPLLFTSAITVRRTAIQSIGGFPLGIKSGEDLLTWARLAIKYHIAYSKKVLAIFLFDEGVFNEDQRKRVPEEKDIVGLELKELYRQNKSITGLKTYVALWHKMRARIFIQKRHRWKALTECNKSIQYDCNAKILSFIVIALLPYTLSNYIFHKWG